MTETVFIVDDEPSVRDAVSLLLETHGYRVAAYESVPAFLAAPFEAGAIVSDVRMPTTTGLDLLRTLQAKDDPRPIILLTGHGDIEMAVQALKLGAFDFIEKPPDSERILIATRNALGHKRLAEENRRLKKRLAEEVMDNATLKEMLTKNF